MKTLIVLLMMVGITYADESRTWTNTDGKTIVARIIDKKPDNSEARLSMKNGKAPWVKSDTLSEEDNEYIKAWKKMPLGFKYLTVEMVGNPGKGLKVVQAVATTWAVDATMTITSMHPSKGSISACRPVAAHSSETMEMETGNAYRVTLVDADGNTLSNQTNASKD